MGNKVLEAASAAVSGGVSAQVGDRGVIRAPVEGCGWANKGEIYDVAADFTIVEILGGSVRVEIGTVSGISRRQRKDVKELLEGWHKIADILPASKDEAS